MLITKDFDKGLKANVMIVLFFKLIAIYRLPQQLLLNRCFANIGILNTFRKEKCLLMPALENFAILLIVNENMFQVKEILL